MTRKILFVIGLMMATISSIANDVVTNTNFGRQVFLHSIYTPVGYDDPYEDGSIRRPKSPMHAPEVYLDDHTLSFSYNNGYTLELIDASMGDEGTVVYTAVIPEDVLTRQLPADITGDYIIRLIHGNWTFVGDIEL